MKNLATALKRATSQSISAIATNMGIPQTTLNRQAKQNEIGAELLTRICITYKVGIVDILEDADLLTPSEARAMRGVQDLGDYSELELAEEIYNRELDKQVGRARGKYSYAQAAETDNQPDLPEGEMY